MSILSVYALAKYYGAQHIFSDVGFQVARGDKIAIVGVNGAGKSTLLKIIAGDEDPTSGQVSVARGIRVAVLAQEATFTTSRTLREELDHSMRHLNALRDEIASLEAALADTGAPEWEARMERYAELTQRFEHAGGYDIERRMRMIVAGLGFDDRHLQQPVVQFSGGQKTRAAMAAALLADPDLLLLDEPTNHLDLAALEWLERFLRDWDGTLIVVSHDRYFLDRVTNRTLEVAFGRLDGDYPAGYERYLALKAARLELQLKQFQAQQEYIARTEDFIRRFKNSTLSKQARGRERRLERLKEGWQGGSGRVERLLERPEERRKLSLDMRSTARGGDLVLRLEKLEVGFALARGEHRLLHIRSAEITRGRRVALMGPNGSGKTTLLRTMVGELPPLRGVVRLGHRVTITYYAQAHEALRPDALIIEEIRRVRPSIKEVEARTLLGRFLFSGDDVFKRVGDLSGGERSRVALAQLSLLEGNLLVLDEPTNHLDIDARQALETVLNEFDGTILFVSHDRYFVDAVADAVWMVQDGALEFFDGNYTEYVADRDARAARAARAVASSAPAAAAPAAAAASDDERREERRRQRRLQAIEAEIARLEAELRGLEAEITSAGERGDVAAVSRLGARHASLNDELAARYDEWAAAA